MARRKRKRKLPPWIKPEGPPTLSAETLVDFVRSFTMVDYTKALDGEATWTQDCLRILQWLVRGQRHGRREIIMELTEGASIQRLRLIELPEPGSTAATALEDSGIVRREDIEFWKRVVETALLRVAPRLLPEAEIQTRLQEGDPERIVLGRRPTEDA